MDTLRGYSVGQTQPGLAGREINQSIKEPPTKLQSFLFEVRTRLITLNRGSDKRLSRLHGSPDPDDVDGKAEATAIGFPPAIEEMEVIMNLLVRLETNQSTAAQLV